MLPSLLLDYLGHRHFLRVGLPETKDVEEWVKLYFNVLVKKKIKEMVLYILSVMIYIIINKIINLRKPLGIQFLLKNFYIMKNILLVSIENTEGFRNHCLFKWQIQIKSPIIWLKSIKINIIYKKFYKCILQKFVSLALDVIFLF